MRRFILLILLFVCSFSKAQTSDSLWSRYNTSKSDTQRVNYLNKLFFSYNTRNNDSALFVTEKAIELSTKINYPLGKASALINLGALAYYKGDEVKALSNYLAALKILENLNGKETTGYLYNKHLSSAYNNLGIIYQGQKQFEKAKKYYTKSIEIDKKMNDKIGMANCYNNIGIIYEEQGNYDEAIKNYELSLQLKTELKDIEGIPSTLINMGVLRMNEHKFKEAESYFKKALSIAQGSQNHKDAALSLINLGDLFYMKKAYKESAKFYENGIKTSKEQGYDHFLSYAYQGVSMTYRKLGNFEKALDNYHYYVEIKDSLYNSENLRALNEMTSKYENEVQEKEIKLLKTEKEIQDLEIQRKRTQLYVFIGGCLLLTLLVIVVSRAYISKRKNNLELDLKNQKIESAYSIIEQKQKEIVDSINYAKRIQYTILANSDLLNNFLSDHFIFYKPKDIVSGDFYWATKHGSKYYLAICDCTGHGVPGSFMSVLSIGFLSEAINEKNILEPNRILDYVKARLITTVSRDGQKDGFDGILLCLDVEKNNWTYAAANNAPVLSENNQVKVLPKNRMPVGYGDYDTPFELHSINAEKDAMLYLFTDGYSDQFGGPKGKKYMNKRFEELLFKTHQLTLEQQAITIENEFSLWKGTQEQVDDVCIIGIRLT